MGDDPLVIVLVPVAAALIAVAGSIYVGWRQRRLTKQMLQWRQGLADEVLRKQLCHSLGSRILRVEQHAQFLERSLAALDRLGQDLGEAEVQRRLTSFDRTCESLWESWADLTTRGLASDELANCIDRLSDALETFWLERLLNPEKSGVDSEDLELVRSLARRSREMTVRLAAQQG